METIVITPREGTVNEFVELKTTEQVKTLEEELLILGSLNDTINLTEVDVAVQENLITDSQGVISNATAEIERLNEIKAGQIVIRDKQETKVNELRANGLKTLDEVAIEQLQPGE